MAENSRPPVAIRIVRPYENEEEFLEAELETVGKTSVILIGAHPRPTGVILRFEVTLTNGSTVLRGEGRVLAHKDNAFRGQPGLSLRFTRLDPRSKALVDRATSMREAKQSGGPRSQPPAGMPAPGESSRPSMKPTHSRPAGPPDAAIAQALTADTPEPARASRAPMSARPRAHQVEDPPTHVETRTDYAPPAGSSTEAPSSEAPSTEAPSAEAPSTEAPSAAPSTDAPTPLAGEVASIAAPSSAPATAPSTRPERRAQPIAAGTLEPPPNRTELLARLRERAAAMPVEKVESIFASRR